MKTCAYLCLAVLTLFGSAYPVDEVTDQYQLAGNYCRGEGVPQNPNKALRLYQSIAERGDCYYSPMAALDLANFYRRGGCGFSKNALKAVSWYKRCAKQGHYLESGMASQILAVMYHKGKEIPRNLVKAGAWAMVSVVQGNRNAEMSQRMIHLDLTDAQKAQAKSLAIRLLRTIPRTGPC